MLDRDRRTIESEGKLQLEQDQPVYKRSWERTNHVWDEMKDYLPDYLGVSTYPVYRLMDLSYDFFDADRLEEYGVDKLLHFGLSYGITGTVYRTMDRTAEFMEAKGWEETSKFLEREDIKFGAAFMILNSLGFLKEIFMDGGIGPTDIAMNNLGFSLRTLQEYQTKEELEIKELIKGLER